MKKFIIASLCGGLFASVVLADWVMFSDESDTYLYNNKTGDVYVRYRKGGKSYQDVFVKMPQGMSASEVEAQSKISTDSKEDTIEEMIEKKPKDTLDVLKQKSLKQSQEMMNNILEEDFSAN